MRDWTRKFLVLFGVVLLLPHEAYGAFSEAASISIDVSSSTSRPIPDTLFGVFFEEINHAGVGGLWAELVMNKGFEAGGQHSPSQINPWEAIGNDDSISITTDLSSCFTRNKVALRMDVLCDQDSCPSGGVGVYNPGFGGMNIEEGKKYKVTLCARSSGPLDLFVSFVGEDTKQVLDTTDFSRDDNEGKDWRKLEATLVAKATSRNSSLHITSNTKGTIWLDQVSAMPEDTYMGHGFRKDLMQMIVDLKPRFLRFPGGNFVEGTILQNAFRWKETVGPWEERPGHYNDLWGYWTDDGLGYLEFLQLAEDLGASPIWVINAGIGIALIEQVKTSLIEPFVQELLDSLEFAMGDANSTWGSLRAEYGHPQPFDIKYVAIGNENCATQYTMYQGNYLKFYHALKSNYPNIQVINNCDASSQKLDVPADLFDFHIYSDPENMFSKAHQFDNQPRSGPKVFVSEYAVTDSKNNKGTLMGALGEAGFLIGLEQNSDIVSMASYAPLLMHRNDPRWQPDAINFDSWQAFGIPSYWMQTFFSDSSGANLLTLKQSTSNHFIASAITYKNSDDGKNYIKLKVVNFQNSYVYVSVSLNGVDSKSIKGFKKTVLTSDNPYDLNTFDNPTKVIPKSSSFTMNGTNWHVMLKPYSLNAFDLLYEPEGKN